MRCALIVLMLGVCSAAGLCAPLSDEQAETLQEAQQHYQNERYSRAADALEGLIEKRPDLAEAHRLLGHVRYEQGDAAQAQQAFARAIAHGRITVGMLSRMAQMARETDDVTAALSAAGWLRLLEPGKRQWRLLQAALLERSGAAERAEPVYRGLIEDAPAETRPRVRLGNLLLRSGRDAEAARQLVTAYHLGRDEPALARTIGDLRARQRMPAAAAAWYERAGPRDEADAGERLRRARLLHRAGQFEKARRVAQSIVDDGGERVADAHRLLGQIALDRGRKEEAVAHWGAAVKAGLTDAQVLAYLAGHHFNAGDYERAAGYFRRRVEAGGAGASVFRRLAVSRLRAGEAEKAKEALRRYVERAGLNDRAAKLIRQLRQRRGGS